MIVEGKIYKLSELAPLMGMGRAKVVKLIVAGRLKTIPHEKGEGYRVIGKYAIEFLEGNEKSNNS